mgnify:FL=1|tara:strand:- start:311 stop:523 length:213 start_codon:yes stop_codon:yes gene_type:complete
MIFGVFGCRGEVVVQARLFCFRLLVWWWDGVLGAGLGALEKAEVENCRKGRGQRGLCMNDVAPFAAPLIV